MYQHSIKTHCPHSGTDTDFAIFGSGPRKQDGFNYAAGCSPQIRAAAITILLAMTQQDARNLAAQLELAAAAADAIEPATPDLKVAA